MRVPLLAATIALTVLGGCLTAGAPPSPSIDATDVTVETGDSVTVSVDVRNAVEAEIGPIYHVPDGDTAGVAFDRGRIAATSGRLHTSGVDVAWSATGDPTNVTFEIPVVTYENATGGEYRFRVSAYNATRNTQHGVGPTRTVRITVTDPTRTPTATERRSPSRSVSRRAVGPRR